MMNKDPQWLNWVKRLQATAQNGFLYSESKFDHERYAEIQTVAAEMAAAYSELDFPRIKDLFSAEQGAATPKVDVRGVIIRNNKILLVRETSDHKWTLPGGWANVDDTPSAAVEREVFEETGFNTRATKVLAVYDRNRQGHAPPYPYPVFKILFRCEILGGKATPSIETSAVEFFAENKIPELSRRRTTSEQITRMFEQDRHPDWPTDFD